MECSDQSDIGKLQEAINAMSDSKKGFKALSGKKEDKKFAQESFDESLSLFNKILDARRAHLPASSENRVGTRQERLWCLSKDLAIVAWPSNFMSENQIHKVNDDLMGDIFCINHVPIRVTQVSKDGNCYFYSIRCALLDMKIPNLESAGVFASALRWFVVCAVEHYNKGSILKDEGMLHQMRLDIDGDEDLSRGKVYVDQIPCSFRLSFAFKMDITCIAMVWNYSTQQFVVEVRYFRYQKEKYEKWSANTTLKDKFSFHHWDPHADKLSIDKFRQVGGVAIFVEYDEKRLEDGDPVDISSLFEKRPNHIVIGWTDVLCNDGLYRGHHCAFSGGEQQVSTVSLHDKEHLTDLVSWIQNRSREEKFSVRHQSQSRKEKASAPEPLSPELVERSDDEINAAWSESDFFLLAFVRAFGPTCRSDEALKNTFFDLLKEMALPLDDIDDSGAVVLESTDLSSTMDTASRLLDPHALSNAAMKVYTAKDGCFFLLCGEIPALTTSGEQLYTALEQLTRREGDCTKEGFFTYFKSLIVSKRDDVYTQLKSFIHQNNPSVQSRQDKKRKGVKDNLAERKSARNGNPSVM